MSVRMSPKGTRRKHKVSVVLTDQELAWLKEDAEEKGMGLSTYARIRLLYSDGGEKAKMRLLALRIAKASRIS